MQDIELPRRYLPSGGAGTLGYEVPAAIGAKVACPNDPVVVVVGDAGFLFMGEELAMAGQHEIPIIVVVVNNGNLGLIRQNQKYAYGYEHGVACGIRTRATDLSGQRQVHRSLWRQRRKSFRCQGSSGGVRPRHGVARCPT